LRITVLHTTKIQWPNRLRSEETIQLPDREIKVVQVIDGDQGWISEDGRMMPLKGFQLNAQHESIYTSKVQALVPLLTDKTFRLETIGSSDVGGHPARGVKVTSEGHAELQLYFDEDSGRLVKLVRIGEDPVSKRRLVQDTYYRDYKDVDGLSQPMTLVIFLDGRKMMDCAITEWACVEKFDDELFAKP
jgi:hypothetical protein